MACHYNIAKILQKLIFSGEELASPQTPLKPALQPQLPRPGAPAPQTPGRVSWADTLRMVDPGDGGPFPIAHGLVKVLANLGILRSSNINMAVNMSPYSTI